MLYELVLVTAVGVQNVGSFTDDYECHYAAEEWKAQGIPAGCVQVLEPTDHMTQMFKFMNDMKLLSEQMAKGKEGIK